jgi:hypothetical protein
MTDQDGGGNFGGWRCPRCHNTDLHGRHRKFGDRVIEEFYCPKCGNRDTADSDQPTYLETLERWRAPAA